MSGLSVAQRLKKFAKWPGMEPGSNIAHAHTNKYSETPERLRVTLQNVTIDVKCNNFTVAHKCHGTTANSTHNHHLDGTTTNSTAQTIQNPAAEVEIPRRK